MLPQYMSVSLASLFAPLDKTVAFTRREQLKFDPAGLKDQFGMRFKNAQERLGGSQVDHMTKLAVNS